MRLLECGNDTALIIPYLNKVLLRLDNKRWIRDVDVSTLAPFDYVGNYSDFRRAANILLAYNIPDGEPASVNEDALQILKRHARKDELDSPQVRTDILSVIKLKTRVSGWGLDVTAEEVFKSKPELLPFLIREMIHDRLMMKRDFSQEHIPREGDAYYVAFYLRLKIDVRNNIRWAPGILMTGITWNARGRAHGYLYRDRVEGVSIAYRNPTIEKLYSGQQSGPILLETRETCTYQILNLSMRLKFLSTNTQMQ